MTSDKTNISIASFSSYNSRRYSKPWVCRVDSRGTCDFSVKIGTYTGEDGDKGELVVFEPKQGEVYCFGQKDYRKTSNSVKEYAVWNGEEFVTCNKLGQIK